MATSGKGGGVADDEANRPRLAASALVDAERFLALRRALDAGIFDPSGGDRDADFAFG